MVEVVIIGQNEGEHVDNMVNSIPDGFRIIYVADRCTDDTLEKLSKHDNVDVIDTTPMGLEGRQTSFCRNLGLSRTDPESDVLFLDGDRHIVSGSIKDAIEECDTDILLFSLEDDNRIKSGWFTFEEMYGDVIGGFYSCGILFKRNAINKVKSTPIMHGQLFPEFMQDEWGIEDTSLGDVCYSIGLTAKLETGVRLRGSFERNYYDSIDTIERRFKFRDKLPNVKWSGRTRVKQREKNIMEHFVGFVGAAFAGLKKKIGLS